MAPRFIARQLARPTGWGGAIIRFIMNRGNARLNRLAVSELAVGRDDRVLEIGFGGGVALPHLLARAAFTCGVDRSEDVVVAARRRFSSAVESGAAEFKIGSVGRLPVPSASFDKVLSVNTVYFWTSLEGGMAEIRRVLAPGGKVAIGFVPKVRMDRMNMPPDIFTPQPPDQIAQALRSAGFRDVQIRAPRGPDRAMVATGVASEGPSG